MSEGEGSNYSDIDYLLQQKQIELNELGAMRLKALERTNEELKEQIDKFSSLLQIKEDENEQLHQQFMHSSYQKEDYENRIERLTQAIEDKEASFYNELMVERKKSHDYKQETVIILI
jgi:hypothetical protein